MRTKLFFFFLSFLCFFLSIFHESSALNQDLGRHLLLGNIILTTHSIPDTNLLSYTNPTFPFYNHHYFSEIIYSLIQNSFGTTGLYVMTIFLLLFTFFFCIKSTHFKGIALGCVTIIWIGLLMSRTEIRPEIFSYFFLSVFIFILYRHRNKSTKLIFTLPFIQVIWTNTHIYFPLGLIVIFLFLLEKMILRRKLLIDAYLLFSLFLCGFTTLLNPHLLQGALYPLTVFKNYGYSIEENQSIFFFLSRNFLKPSIYFLLTAASFFLILFFTRLTKIRLIDILLFIVFLIIAMSAVRHIPLFAVCISPGLLYLFSDFFTAKSKRFLYISSWIVTGLLVTQAILSIKSNEFGFRIQEDGKQALDFYKKNSLQGPVFNNFDIGSYLAYRLYPKEKIFIDGRPEAYPADFFQSTYIPMQEDQRRFKEVDRKYNFNTIIFSHTDQTPWAQLFLRDILTNSSYVPIYLDQDMILLSKITSQNKNRLSPSQLSATDTPMRLPDNPTINDLQKAANFYSVVNQPKNLTEVLIRLVEKDPENCSYLIPLASLMSRVNNPTAIIYQAKLDTFCQ